MGSRKDILQGSTRMDYKEVGFLGESVRHRALDVPGTPHWIHVVDIYSRVFCTAV